MRLNDLTASARGWTTRLHFGTAISLLTGPTGAGKTTALDSIQVALGGTITRDGKTRSKPGDVFELMSADGEPVSTQLDFGGHAPMIERIIALDSEGACGQTIKVSGIQVAKISDAEKLITEQIGDLARVDIPGLLGKDPAKRKAEILQACRSVATPIPPAEISAEFERVVEEAVREAAELLAKLQADEKASPEKVEEIRQIAEAARPVYRLEIDRTKGLLGSAEGARDVAKEALKAATDKIKAMQQAIDAYVEQSAKEAEAGDIDEMNRRLAELDQEITEVSQKIGAASNAQQTRDGIKRRLDELAALPAEDAAQQALRAAQRAQAIADEALREAIAEPAPPPAEPDDLVSLRDQVKAQTAARDEAWMKASKIEGDVDRLQRALARISEGGCCPTCARPMDESARAAIQAELDSALHDHAAALTERNDAGELLECLDGELNAATEAYRNLLATAKAEAANVALTHQAKARDAADAARATADAEKSLAQVHAAVAERQKLRIQADGIELADVSMLEQQRGAAEAQRAELKKRAEAVAADEARQQQHRKTIVDRDDLREQVPTLKLAVKAYTAVADFVGQRAVGPLVERTNKALPVGWELSINVAEASFGIWREGRLVPWAGLSGGQRAIGLAALVVGMGSIAGNRWRCPLIDGAEAIGGPEWDDGTDAGLFAAFCASLAQAVEKNLIDQVIMTSNRAPLGLEAQALAQSGVGIHWMGALRDSGSGHAGDEQVEKEDDAPLDDAGHDVGDAPSGPPAAPVDLRAAERDIKARLAKGVSVEALEYLMRTFTNRTNRPVSGSVLKQVVLEGAVACVEKGRTVGQIIGLIERAAVANPVRARGAGATGEIPAPEIGPVDNAG